MFLEIKFFKFGYQVVGGEAHRAFALLRGVLQGCPLAAILIITFEPVLRLLASGLGPRDCALAGADDLIVIVGAADTLASMQHAFDLAGNAASLFLSSPKCVLIPLWAALSPQVTELLRMVIFRVAPLLHDAAIQVFAVFLGGLSSREQTLRSLGERQC